MEAELLQEVVPGHHCIELLELKIVVSVVLFDAVLLVVVRDDVHLDTTLLRGLHGLRSNRCHQSVLLLVAVLFLSLLFGQWLLLLLAFKLGHNLFINYIQTQYKPS